MQARRDRHGMQFAQTLERKFVGAAALVMFILAVAASWAAVAIDRFEADIRSFEARDKASPPPQHGTVFVGSSTFTRWTALEQEFKGFQAINRGFGGSTIPEITHYTDRIIVPYHPRTVVFYAGTNDVADGHSAEQVCADFRAFVAHLRARLPEVRIIFLSMNIPPSRVRFSGVYEDGNACIRKWIAAQRGLVYVDVATAMYDAAGQPQPSLYTTDMLHMNAQGYARWIMPIKQALTR